MIKKILFLTLITIFTSCSTPLNKRYSDKTIDQDAKAIRESGELDSIDFQLIAGWIMKSKFQEKDLSNKTYREILKEAKDFKKQQEELAKKAKKEAEQKKKKMQNAMVISLYDKGYSKGDYQDYNSFSYILKNKSDKDIKAFKFSFEIYNVLGDELGNGYRVSSTDKIIKTGEEFKSTIYYDYNEFSNDDVEIKKAKFDDLTFKIKVSKIVYTDGTILE